jgi:hypothetical protein
MLACIGQLSHGGEHHSMKGNTRPAFSNNLTNIGCYGALVSHIIYPVFVNKIQSWLFFGAAVFL